MIIRQTRPSWIVHLHGGERATTREKLILNCRETTRESTAGVRRFSNHHTSTASAAVSVCSTCLFKPGRSAHTWLLKPGRSAEACWSFRSHLVAQGWSLNPAFLLVIGTGVVTSYRDYYSYWQVKGLYFKKRGNIVEQSSFG